MSDRTDRPLRVLEIESFGRGGLAHYAFRLSAALAERGHHVDLLTADGFELQHLPLPQGMQIHTPLRTLSRRLGGGWPGALSVVGRKGEAVIDAFRAARRAKALAPDVIHLHSTNTSAVAYLQALRGVKAALVATTHVVTPHEPVASQQAVYGRIHRLPDRLIAHSNKDRQRLLEEFRIAPEKTAVVPHGDYGFFADVAADADPARARAALGIPAPAPTVLFFGYLRPYKGLDLLLDAWPMIAGQYPDARLLIAGDPVRLSADEQRALRERADALGATHRFEYIPLDAVASWFAAADLLVLPYRNISQSGVLYLALALGVPVVATAVGAWPEMLTNNENALLVPPEDVGELAGAVSRALGDARLRARLSEGGRRLAAEHSWDRIAIKTEQVFKETIDVLGTR